MAKKPLSTPREEIRLTLTRDEFRHLLHLAYIATWVLEAHKTAPDPRTVPYDELEQKLFAIAARHGFADPDTDPADHLVEYAPEFEKYFPTRTMEQGQAHRFIDEYDNDTFWDELIDGLSLRDAIREVGSFERFAELSWEERITRQARYEEIYAAEFEEHGLDNLRITRPRTPPHRVH